MANEARLAQASNLGTNTTLNNQCEREIAAHGGYVGYSVAPLNGERVLHIKCKDNTEIPVQNLPTDTLNRLCCEDPEFERFLNGITTPSVHYQAIATELKEVSRAMVQTLRAQAQALAAENQEYGLEILQSSREALPTMEAEREMKQLEAENTQLAFALRDAQMEIGLVQAQRKADTARLRASVTSLIDAKRLLECILPSNNSLLNHSDPVVQTHMTTTNEAYWRLSEILGKIIDEVEDDDTLPEPETPAAAPQLLLGDGAGLDREATPLPAPAAQHAPFDLASMLLGESYGQPTGAADVTPLGKW